MAGPVTDVRQGLVAQFVARLASFRALLAACLFGPLLSGCAAVTNPVATAIPVGMLPPALLAKPKDGAKTIPLSLLGQLPPRTYQLAAGDVLGVWIEGVLGEPKQSPPIHTSPMVKMRDQQRLPPALGYPVQVREDGTISLPQVGTLQVQGMSLSQVEQAIRNAYTVAGKLLAPTARIAVTLMHGRQYRVYVLRQESPSFLATQAGVVGAGTGKQGTGTQLSLPAYQNDVLTALTQTNGLPGLDTCNEVIVFRGGLRGLAGVCDVEKLMKDFPGAIVRIPLRLPPNKPLPFRPEDVILQDGDVVFLEARTREVYFTGGLLPPAEQVLPRDYDLDVVTAILRARGSVVNGAFATSNLTGTLINPGIGNPSPDLLIVLRPVPGYGRVPIRVELSRAMRDPRENLLIASGDVLLLQETPAQAVFRWFYQSFFNFNLLWEPIHSRYATGIMDVSAPDRLPGRLGAVNFPIPPQ